MPFQDKLLDLGLGAGFLQLGNQLLGVFLGDGFLQGLGAVVNQSLASFRPRPVAARTTLITPSLEAPALFR